MISLRGQRGARACHHLRARTLCRLFGVSRSFSERLLGFGLGPSVQVLPGAISPLILGAKLPIFALKNAALAHKWCTSVVYGCRGT
jgi:hypothetical protein